MKHKIQYRVWDKSEKKYVEYSFGLDRDGELRDSYGDCLIHDDYIVEQFIGLKDRNGQKIYEGDILKFTQCLFNTNPENYPVKTKVVKWDSLVGKWTVYETRAGEIDLRVIGNIHENPDLLK